MKLKSNKGSSLMLITVLLMVILTVGGAILATLNANYKAKAKESQRIQNLYEAESGLDIAYNIIVKIFDAAILAANDEVERVLDEIDQDLSDKEIEEEKNKAFRKGFNDYTYGGINEFQRCINENKIIVTDNYNSSVEHEKYQDVVFNTDIIPTISYIESDSKLDNESYEIVVQSIFETESSTGNNKREVQVTYNVDVPDFRETKVLDSTVGSEIPKELDNKVVAIDGDMKIEGNSNQEYTMTGDVFVKGKETSIGNSIVYDKYNGGIEITGQNAGITFDGKIVTPGTFNVSSDNGGSNNSIINANSLYAGNLYVGNKNGTYANRNQVTIENITIDNDLAVKSSGSEITIGDFYGINDKNIEGTVLHPEEKSSSSIIINNDKGEGSKIEITNDAYIMGTAYINARNDNGDYYQTGESVAVKGNYIAYTKSLDPDYEFDYYNPLQLVDKKSGESLGAIEKSKYFEEFMKQNPGDLNKDNEILLPDNTVAAGAIVRMDNDNNLIVERSTYNMRANNLVDDKREEYAKEVCLIGSASEEDNLRDVYEDQSKYQKTVADSLINFESVIPITEHKDNQYLIMSDQTLVITDRSTQYIAKENETVIEVNGGELEALIINNGDVKLVGDFEFRGAIIGSGDLEITNRKDKSISYDKEVVNNITYNNYYVLKDIYREGIPQSPEDEKGEEVTYIYKYDTKEYIKQNNWKIIKNG